jgi:hypothetical protein
VEEMSVYTTEVIHDSLTPYWRIFMPWYNKLFKFSYMHSQVQYIPAEFKFIILDYEKAVTDGHDLLGYAEIMVESFEKDMEFTVQLQSLYDFPLLTNNFSDKRELGEITIMLTCSHIERS